jgi:hypothetical protein
MLSLLFALLPFAQAAPYERATGQLIYSGRDNLCLSPQGGRSTSPSSGIAVVSLPCDQASTWDINRGSGSILLSGTNFALDAGSSPGNNGALKVCLSPSSLFPLPPVRSHIVNKGIVKCGESKDS